MLFKNQSKGEKIKKRKQGRVTVLVHCPLSHCQKHAYHGNLAATDQSNTYMLPSQATQKLSGKLNSIT